MHLSFGFLPLHFQSLHYMYFNTLIKAEKIRNFFSGRSEKYSIQLSLQKSLQLTLKLCHHQYNIYKGLKISFLLFELHLHVNVHTQILFIQNDHYFLDMFSCLPQHAQREILLQAAGGFMHSF